MGAGAAANGGMDPMMAAMMGQMGGGGMGGMGGGMGGMGGGMPGGMGGMGGMPGGANMNMDQVMGMLNNPGVQQMMQQLTANPQALQAMIQSKCLF